jgi:large subunit ribosomal protein L17
MRHQNGIKKLGRTGSHRRAMLRNMAIALFRHERIQTTGAKAKALRPYAEQLITLAKRGDLHSRRLAARYVHDHAVLQKLFSDLAERFRTREGGYTRVLKLGVRRGDNSMTALIELVDRAPVASKEPVAAAAG